MIERFSAVYGMSVQTLEQQMIYAQPGDEANAADREISRKTELT
jgi:hypothetical protein